VYHVLMLDTNLVVYFVELRPSHVILFHGLQGKGKDTANT